MWVARFTDFRLAKFTKQLNDGNLRTCAYDSGNAMAGKYSFRTQH